jgi:hypothetical protein
MMQVFCLYWCVFPRIPIIWHHDKVVWHRISLAKSCHSFIITMCWYNVLYQTGYISKSIISIFPELYCPYFSKRSIVGWLYSDTESDWTVCDMSFVNEWQHIIRCYTQNVVSLKNIVQIVNFNSTFVILEQVLQHQQLKQVLMAT